MKDCDFDKFHRGRVLCGTFDARNRTWAQMKQRRQRALRKAEQEFAEEHISANVSSRGQLGGRGGLCAHRHREAGTCRDAEGLAQRRQQ